MEIAFSKMHGLGNDFMVLDLVTRDLELTPELIRRWADRRTGVGFDQLLTIQPPTGPDADFRYRIYNADGNEVEQCGNGARCAALFIADNQLSPLPRLTLETFNGPIVTRRLNAATVAVDMGIPDTQPNSVPFKPPEGNPQPEANGGHQQPVTVNDQTVWITPVSIGNPHGVLFVDDIGHAPVLELGQLLTDHPCFPEGANIGFCQIVDRSFARLRVFERGVGETRACGTGACAAVVAGHLQGKLDEEVKISLPGGKVRISWQGPGTLIRMSGPAALVYEGQISHEL
ncbi:MAG: diaminopimelate epimerase [Gammaproteobacteria bacterium]|nr:diaminopimelate epimerase [Gammaproteobacteria bacterium]